MTNAIVLATALLCACFSTGFAYSDSDILNFALNLECLEAEFYSWAAFGKGLTSEQRGGGPPSIGGMKANLGEYQGAAEEIATEEIKHVELLRGALGHLAVKCPKMDIGPAFSAAANAALGTTLEPAFSPYADYVKFLHGALLFEDVGVMAYNGAIGVIRSPAFAAVARSIMAVESYHGGIIRSMLSEEFNTIVTPYNAPVSAITGAISVTLDALLGLDRKQPIGPLNKMPNLTPTDSNALAYAVSPAAVINVVYLSTTSKMGGFYPDGITGLLGMTRGELADTCKGNSKAGRYEQCGGLTFVGPTCCSGFNTCVMANEFYSHCLPTMPPAGVVAAFGTCGGGKMYKGPSECEPGTKCVKKNKFYSQCLPTK